jgi:DNA-binding NarL/FixJ family response regulator
MPDASIRLAIADDHPIVLQGLQQLFARHPGFEVLASCKDGDEALAAVRRGGIDVLVLDLRMPGRDGLGVLRQMAAESLKCQVVLLTAVLQDADVAEVVRLGARGLVLKESPPEALIDCVRRVHAGEQWIDQATLTRAFDHEVRRDGGRRAAGATLTPREREIVRMVAQGLRNRDVGERLFISEGTVKIHLHNVYEKLGVDGRLELVLYAQEAGLI